MFRIFNIKKSTSYPKYIPQCKTPIIKGVYEPLFIDYYNVVSNIKKEYLIKKIFSNKQQTHIYKNSSNEEINM